MSMGNVITNIDDALIDLRACLQDNRADTSLVEMYARDIADQRAIRAAILFTCNVHTSKIG